MRKNDWLPLGSVVILEKGTKPLLIYGRKQYDINREKIWDYVACLYPEGNISSEYTFLFNKDDIKTVIYKGFENEEEKSFRELLDIDLGIENKK